MAIDIMMPFYGDVDLFKLAVDSVRQQQGIWRLVIIDDRYPDDEPQRYVSGLEDSRISYVTNDQNLGISGNFQKSVALAQAAHTVIMGCDDIMLPGYVEHLESLIERYPEAAYFQPGVATINAQGARSSGLSDRVKSALEPRGSRPLTLSGQGLASSLLRGNWTYFPSLCWNTSVIKAHGFRADYEIVLDLALQIEIAKAGGTLVVDDSIVFEYRRHASSASSWSSSDDKRFTEEKRFFLETAHQLAAVGWAKAARIARSHLSSRLNAASQLPGAVLRRDRAGISALATHLLSR